MQQPDRRARALFRKLERIPAQILAAPTPESVHQLRTTIRRVETLIAAGPDGLPGSNKLLRQLRTLRRRAGRLRDVDVQIAALRTVHTAATRDKAEVRHALDKVHEKQERKLVDAIETELADGLEKRIRRAGKALTELPAAMAKERPGVVLAAALDKFADLTAQYPPLNEDNLHGFRMRCKRIRYLAEMDADPARDRAIRELKRIQGAIGEWHDWVNLTQTAEEVLSDDNSALIGALRAGRRAKFNEALRVVPHAGERLLAMHQARQRKSVARAQPDRVLHAHFAVAS